MAAVRYIALIALVFWTGGMAGALFADVFARPQLLAFGCGGLVLVALTVVKFVGPPPRAFFLRAGVTGAMLLLAIAALVRPSVAPAILALNFALALFLLFWYVRE
jgi:hypothetical protein